MAVHDQARFRPAREIVLAPEIDPALEIDRELGNGPELVSDLVLGTVLGLPSVQVN